MSTPRVAPWQEGDPVQADLLERIQARRPGGSLIGIDRVLLRSLPLADGWNALLGRVRADFNLELEYRELIMLRVAVLNGASFEWGVHLPAYLQAGGSNEKAEALLQTNVAGTFSAVEQMLITLTDQSTRQVSVDVEVIEALKVALGESQTVEAVATVAAYNMVSRFLVALGIH